MMLPVNAQSPTRAAIRTSAAGQAPKTAPTSPVRDSLSLGSEQWHYRGISKGFQVNWTSRDLQAWYAQDMSRNEPSFSLRKLAQAPCQEGEFRCIGDSQVQGQLSAQVGRYLSYQESSSGYVPGAAHDWASTTFHTVDMATGKPVKLTDLFPEAAIHQALMKDALVQQALAGARPKNFQALVEALDGKQSPDGKYIFSRDMFENFTFHHVKGNDVAIRLAIPYGVEVYRGSLTQLGMYLPMPAELKTDLMRAADRTAGILMSDVEKNLSGRSTNIEIEQGKPLP